MTLPGPSPLRLPAFLETDVAELRRMKRRATGLLAGTAGLFVLSSALPDTTATGFLQAAAEAGTVGGLADWFAVTALFRHPLGLRIPHTALVPRKKDELATKLGEFVTGNFLTADAVIGQLAEAQVVRRSAEWLAEPEHARRVAVELSTAVAAALDALDARALTDSVLELVRRDLDRRSYAPVLGQFLARAVEGQGQQPLVDICVTQLRMHLVRERDTLRPLLKGYLESQSSLFFLFVTDARVDTLILRAVELLGEVEQDPDHPARRWLDGLLASLADDLRYKRETAQRVDAWLRALVDDHHMQALLHAVLVDVAASVRTSLDDLDGGLQTRLTALVGGAARRVLDDAALQARIEERVHAAVGYAVEHYGDTVVALISRTVQGWEAQDASARIEAAVGRDLQFIRINGTVVGALAGVVLHSVAVLVG